MKCHFFVFILIALICCISSKEKSNDGERKILRNFCGVNYLKMKMNVGTTTSIKNISSKTRRLSTEYFPIRIFVDTTYLDVQIQNLPDMQKHLPMIKRALKKAVDAMSKLLEVEQIVGNIYTGMNSTLFETLKISKWDEKLNDTAKMSLEYDYILLTRFADIDEFPSTVQAAAMPALLEENTNRPIIGLMMISSSLSFYTKDKAENYFNYVFLHELTHAFGFVDGAYEKFPGGRNQTLLNHTDEYGINRTYIRTPKVVEMAKKYFGCENVKGIPVENQGSPGSASSHWEARVLLGEYMTSEFYEDEVAISEITLALLEDTNWYKVNYYTGGLMRFGKNKGCDFLNLHCLDISTFQSRFPNEFFGLDLKDYPSCSTGRQSRTIDILNFYPSLDQDQYYKLAPTYLDQPTQKVYYVGGPFYSADYCPLHFHVLTEYEESHFVGNCKIGNGNYGSYLYYRNLSTGIAEMHRNGELPKELGEKYSENSFCMMSNLVPNGIDEMYGTLTHPMCFPSFCSSSSLTVLINDQYIVCPKQGGNVEVEGYSGKLHCPDYNLICTGTVLCNDLFDCIDKKSKYKEDTFTYDYKPLTTQRYFDIPKVETIVAGETSDDGICPKNCVQCTENKKCKLCLNGYNLIGKEENDNKPIICDKETDVEKGYYKKDNIYYYCHKNCETCSSGPISDHEMNCDTCREGYEVVKVNNKTNCIMKEEPGSKDEEKGKTEPSNNNIFLYVIITSIVLLVLIIIIVLICIKMRRVKTQRKIEDINSNIGDQKDIPLF